MGLGSCFSKIGLRQISAISVLVAIVSLWCPDAVDAVCCPWHATTDLKCQCDDGVNVHPWECCSSGACNVFCCNCGGPCRTNSTPSTIVATNLASNNRLKRDIFEIRDGIYDDNFEMEHNVEAVNSALK